MLHKAKVNVPAKAAHLTMDISGMLLVIFWLTHVVGCAWYRIGRSHKLSDTGNTWLTSGLYSFAGDGYEYSTSLHWAITQITPGSMGVAPKNSTERLFNVCVLFFGLVLGGSLVATLSAIMTQYRLHLEESSRTFRMLHQYLHQECVTSELVLAR